VELSLATLLPLLLQRMLTLISSRLPYLKTSFQLSYEEGQPIDPAWSSYLESRHFSPKTRLINLSVRTKSDEFKVHGMRGLIRQALLHDALKLYQFVYVPDEMIFHVVYNLFKPDEHCPPSKKWWHRWSIVIEDEPYEKVYSWVQESRQYVLNSALLEEIPCAGPHCDERKNIDALILFIRNQQWILPFIRIANNSNTEKFIGIVQHRSKDSSPDVINLFGYSDLRSVTTADLQAIRERQAMELYKNILRRTLPEKN